MTLFTVNPFDDGYFENGEPSRTIEKICFRRWKKLFNEVRVYDFNSEEVKEAIERFPNLYKRCIDTPKEKCVFADVVRLIVLSKYEDHVYFDCDLYPLDDHLKGSGLYYNCFMLMTIGSGVAKELLKQYDDNNLPDNLFDIYDKKIIAKSGLEFSKLDAHVIHFSGIDVNPHYITFAETPEEYTKAIEWWKNGHNNVLKIYRNNKYECEKVKGVQLKNLYKIKDEKDKQEIIEAVKHAERYFEVV